MFCASEGGVENFTRKSRKTLAIFGGFCYNCLYVLVQNGRGAGLDDGRRVHEEKEEAAQAESVQHF